MCDQQNSSAYELSSRPQSDLSKADNLECCRRSQAFIEGFIAYITDREDDFERLFQTMNQIDALLNHDAELLVTLLLGGDEKARHVFSDWGKELIVEFTSIWLWTKIARDKLRYYELGLVYPRRKGDLRNVTLATKSQQLEVAMKFKISRAHPAVSAYCRRESARMEPEFYSRVAKLLKSRPLEFEYIQSPPLRSFLLYFWAIESSDRFGGTLPPLCYCSDPVIAKLAGLVGGLSNVTPANVKKTRERLNLHKASTIVFRNVQSKIRSHDGLKVVKITLSGLGHQEKSRCPSQLR